MLHFLSREERYQCDRQCDEVLSEAMAALLAFDGDVDAREWRVIGRRDQFTVHRSARAATDSSKAGGGARMNVLATGFIHGTLAQIAEGLSAETDEELLTTEALLSGSQVTVTAAAVLNAAERASPRARFRFAGVKWYAWTRESSHDADNQQQQQQEMLTYERMGVTHDDESREVAYHVVRSMDRPEWPLFVARPPGLRRADMALCFLFRAVCDDLVECLVAGSYQARTSSSSQRAADVTIAERVLTITRSLRSYEAKKLSRLMDKARDRPVAMAKNCLRCGARRSVLDPHRNCGICKKSVCSNCRQSKRIFKLNKNLCLPDTAAFCNACLTRARLPSVVAKAQRAARAQDEGKGKLEPVALRRERASLPANLEYKNYDRLLESYAQRRRPRASTSAIPSSSSLLISNSNESFGGSSSSEDVGSAHAPPPVAAMPDGQLLELRRARETVLSFPVARTVVQEDLYFTPGNENSRAASNQAEAVFRHHRERQEQLEELARPNPLHMKLLEEQERRQTMRQAVDGGDRYEPSVQVRQEDGAAAAVVVRRRAMTVPAHGVDAQDERIERAAATLPWSVPVPRGNTDAFRSDLYARF